MSADDLKPVEQFPAAWHSLAARCVEKPGTWRFAALAQYDQFGRGGAYTQIRRLARRWRQFSHSLTAVRALPEGFVLRTRTVIDNDSKCIVLEIAAMQKPARLSMEKLLEESGFSTLSGVDSGHGPD